MDAAVYWRNKRIQDKVISEAPKTGSGPGKSGSGHMQISETGSDVVVVVIDDEDLTFYKKEESFESNMQALNTQREEGTFCDVTLTSGEMEFKVHACVLAANSRYYDCLLRKNDSGAWNFAFPTNNYRVTKILLDYMYTGRLGINMTLVKEIITASLATGIDDVIQCASIHLLNNLSVSNWAQIYSIAKENKLNDLLNDVYEFMANHFREVCKTKGFQDIDAVDLKAIFTKCRSSNTMDLSQYQFCALLSWVSTRRIERIQHYPSLLSLLDFEGVKSACSFVTAAFNSDLISDTGLMGHEKSLELLETLGYREAMEGHSQQSTPGRRKTKTPKKRPAVSDQIDEDDNDDDPGECAIEGDVTAKDRSEKPTVLPFKLDPEFKLLPGKWGKRSEPESGTIDSCKKHLEHCAFYGVKLVLDMETAFINKGFITATDPGILPLEQNLLQVGAIRNVAKGVFYFLPVVYKDMVFIRYIESGCYRGFLPKALELLKLHLNVDDEKIFPWQVYTDVDLQLQSIRTTTGSAPSTTYARKVGSENPSRMNEKKTVMVQICKMKDKLDATRAIVFVHKATSRFQNPSHRFLFCSELWGTEREIIDQQLAAHPEEGQCPPESLSVFAHIEDLPNTTKKEQFLLLSSISNLHCLHSSQIRFSQYILIDIKGEAYRKYLPSSPRNILIHCGLVEYHERLYRTVKNLLILDNLLQEEHEKIFPKAVDPPTQPTQAPDKKRKKSSCRRKKKKEMELSEVDF